jgi:hypothetical protein
MPGRSVMSVPVATWPPGGRRAALQRYREDDPHVGHQGHSGMWPQDFSCCLCVTPVSLAIFCLSVPICLCCLAPQASW